MLDNEPDTTSNAEADSPPAIKTPVRRRRAASRPAGPPSTAAQAELPAPVEAQAETPAPVEAQVELPAPVEAQAETPPPAKKAVRKRATKKAVAPVAESAEGGEAAPPARAPRKRAAKKAAAGPPAEESADDLLALAELIAAGPAPTETETEQTPVPAPAPVAELEPAEPANTLPIEEPAPAPSEPERVSSPFAEQVPNPYAQSVPNPFAESGPVPNPFADQSAEVEPEATAEVETDDPEADVEDDSDAPQVTDDQADDDEGDPNRRRRRRRGGRRRRRTGGDEDVTDSDAPVEDSDSPVEAGPLAAVEEAEVPGAESEPDSEADGDGDSESQRRRRRRRRRRGEDAGSAPDDPTEVVVRVREPRKAKAVNNEVTGIEGSTRMEAKRQRRRDGREAGRRRPPILSEAEFLARREAVSRKMIIRQRDDSLTGSGQTLAQIAVLEDDILVEHYVDRDSAASLIGNVYLGRVQNVLPSMEAAFIDIGRGRNAVLYAGEVDWDSFGAEGQGRKVERVLKSGQTVLVQVSKDPVGSKGARLTNHVSIPGRYIVYAPGGHLSGISRKLPDIERKRLRDILADLVGESASVIVRTAAEGASEEELVRDVNRLKAQWEDIERKVASGSGPQLLYGEPDLTVRIVRDLFTEDFAELIIDGNGEANDAYDAITGYVTHVAPHLAERMHRWESEDGSDVFGAYRLDEQIAKALERKVFLPSGGSLVIDRTEAMTVIDVNTGKFTGSGGNLEATVTSNNLEAAEEIVNQLRLRDIGGIIVIDFIDMVLPNNRELLLRRLVECLGRDRTRHQVAEITSLGLVQMTRKKIGTGLLEAFTSECQVCHGRGFELHDVPVDSQQQADGGTREARPRDQRRGSGQHQPKPSEPKPSDPKPSEPKPSEPKPAPPSHSGGHGDGDGGANESGSAPESNEEERPARRRGGRRRAATREQGAPATSDDRPTAPEPQPVS